MWNAEHASQASQLANRLQQLSGSFKVQATVDSALKDGVVKESFTVIAKMLSSRKKKALSPKVMMFFMALLDDMNGSVFVGNFRSTITGLTLLLENSNMCPLELIPTTHEEELIADHGIDNNLEVPVGLEEALAIVGVNDTDKAAKVLQSFMGKALDEWISASVDSCGVVLAFGMSYSVRKCNLAPEVARLVEMYRNTTLMIAHKFIVCWSKQVSWHLKETRRFSNELLEPCKFLT